MKTCTKCNEDKELEAFGKRSKSIDGLNYWCRACMSHNAKKWVDSNKNRVVENNAAWVQNNKDRRKENQAKYYQMNKVRLRPLQNEAYKRRMKDPLHRVKTRYRNRIAQMYHFEEFKKSSSSADMVGCTWDQLYAHLISTALGHYGIWCVFEYYEIDHIIPLMTASSEEELIRLNHYTNLQLLSLEDHQQKTKQDIVSFKALQIQDK